MTKPLTTHLVDLGKRLSARRKQLGMTLEELAARISISKGNLSEIEAGKRDPRYSTLLVIARGLDSKLCDLLEGRSSLRKR